MRVPRPPVDGAPILLGGTLPHGWVGAFRQLALLATVLFVTQAAPSLAGVTGERALANAGRVVEVERALDLFSEPVLHAWARAHPELLEAANAVYLGAHVPVTALLIVWLYAWRHGSFRRVRTAFLVALALLAIVQALVPTAPPRFLLDEGFRPTSPVFDETASDPTALPYSRFAALPSGHVAFALLVALAAVRETRRRAWQVLWPLYPATVALVVVITAHHFWLDVLAGALVAVAADASAAAAAGRTRRPRPAHADTAPALALRAAGRARPVPRTLNLRAPLSDELNMRPGSTRSHPLPGGGRWALALLLGAVLILVPVAAAPAQAPPGPVAQLGSAATKDEGKASYGQLLAAIERQQVRRAEVASARGEAAVTLKDGRNLRVTLPPGDSALPARLHAAGAEVSVVRDLGRGRSGLGLALVIVVLPLVLALAGLFVFLRRGKTRDRAAAAPPPQPPVPAERFSSVVGADEAVEELAEMLAFLQEPERFAKLGARMPSGALLHGPPGTGKTLLAKALAGEAGLPFFATSGSEFVEVFVGKGAQRVRELFSKARAAEGGAIVFIDELDAIGRRRSGGGREAGDSEREATLNQLLVELDGFQGRERVLVLAATNRVEVLDPALLRPGRLSSQVAVDAPGREGRRALLDLYTREKPLAADVDLGLLADQSAGSTGAELADMTNRAAILAAREGREHIEHADLEEGHLWALAGPPKKEAGFGEGEERKVAVHEAGHVLTAEHLPTHPSSHGVTIRPRGRAGGMAKYGHRDRMLHDRRSLHEQMVTLLGGRAAEQAVFGEVSTGAQNDLQRVNLMARQAVEELGLAEGLGQLVTGGTELSQELRGRVEREVEVLVAAAYRDAQRILAEHRSGLERLADALVAHKDLDRVDIVAALDAAGACRVELPAPAPTRPAARVREAPRAHGARPRRRSVARPALAAFARVAGAARRRVRERDGVPAPSLDSSSG